MFSVSIDGFTKNNKHAPFMKLVVEKVLHSLCSPTNNW